LAIFAARYAVVVVVANSARIVAFLTATSLSPRSAATERIGFDQIRSRNSCRVNRVIAKSQPPG